MFTISQRNAIRKLRAAINSAGVAGFLSIYGTDTARWRQLRFDELIVPHPLNKWIAFLTQGMSLSPGELFDLPSFVVEELLGIGLFQQSSGGITIGESRVVWHYGVLLFCHRSGPSVKAYHGEDSFALARHILNISAGSRVLDLCSGVGAQAVLAAKSGCRVKSVDIVPDIAFFYHINAIFNDVESRVSLFVGNLFEPLADTNYDIIAANPPLLPVPVGLSLGRVADGGRDGLHVAAKIASQSERWLHQDGYLILQGVSFGDDSGPNLERLTEPLMRDGFSIQLFVIYREYLSLGGPFINSLAATLAGETICTKLAHEKILILGGELGGNCLYSWQMIARRSSKATLSIVPFYLRNCHLWVA